MKYLLMDNTTRAILAVAVNLGRYFLFAGAAYLIFYIWKRKEWFYLKIQKKFPDKKDIIREIVYSLSTLFIFALFAIAIVIAGQYGFTQIYWDIKEYSLYYWIFSLGLLILFHDTWFYWTHRWMHSSHFIFNLFHKVHHQSHNPTPWAAFAFHPLEAIVEAMFFPIAVVVFPLHIGVIIIFLFWMIVFNVLGHAGYEIFPIKFHNSILGRWQNTPTHHNMHHRFSRGNYSLYFNLWDKWMGTNFINYEEEYLKNSSH